MIIKKSSPDVIDELQFSPELDTIDETDEQLMPLTPSTLASTPELKQRINNLLDSQSKQKPQAKHNPRKNKMTKPLTSFSEIRKYENNNKKYKKLQNHFNDLSRVSGMPGILLTCRLSDLLKQEKPEWSLLISDLLLLPSNRDNIKPIKSIMNTIAQTVTERSTELFKEWQNTEAMNSMSKVNNLTLENNNLKKENEELKKKLEFLMKKISNNEKMGQPMDLD